MFKRKRFQYEKLTAKTKILNQRICFVAGLLGGIGGFTIGVSFIQAAYIVAAIVLLLILIFKCIRNYIRVKVRGPKWRWLIGRKVKTAKVTEITPDPKEMAFTIIRKKSAKSLRYVSDTALTDVTVNMN